MESLVRGWQTHFADLLGDRAAASACLAITVAVITFLYYFIKTRDLPPGPVGLPFLGYAPFLKDDTCHLQLQEMQKKYGDIFSVNFAGTLYINVGSLKAIKDIHINYADYLERTSDYSLTSFLFKPGIGVINGEPWKAVRKFTIQQFRELGMTTIKDNTSGSMYDSIKETIEFLKSTKGKPIDMIELLMDKCNVLIRRTMFADSGVTQQEVREINESFGNVLAIMSVTNLLYTGILARLVLPFTSGYKEAMKHHKNINKILFKLVNEHKSRLSDQQSGDFIDAYLKERNDRRKRGDPTAEYFTDETLVATLIQFIGDSVISIAIFASRFLNHVVNHKEEQEKIYSELTEVVGHGRAPTLEDKSKMPYTNALILECLRTTDFFTLFPSQQCMKDITVRGYKIPKGAITLMNMWACHHDPNIYEEPDKFDPSRFLPKAGKKRPELPVNFGVGRRTCLGEGFVMAQVFLLLTTIIQNFRLTVPEGSKKKSFELLLSGKTEFCAHPRN